MNTLLSSFTNICDIMAIDQKRYKGGERIVCRAAWCRLQDLGFERRFFFCHEVLVARPSKVRLGAETNPLCGKHPVVAVVPSRMIWWTEVHFVDCF